MTRRSLQNIARFSSLAAYGRCGNSGRIKTYRCKREKHVATISITIAEYRLSTVAAAIAAVATVATTAASANISTITTAAMVAALASLSTANTPAAPVTRCSSSAAHIAGDSPACATRTWSAGSRPQRHHQVSSHRHGALCDRDAGQSLCIHTRWLTKTGSHAASSCNAACRPVYHVRSANAGSYFAAVTTHLEADDAGDDRYQSRGQLANFRRQSHSVYSKVWATQQPQRACQRPLPL